ncbi:MAG: hypothetical protein AB1345_08615 [Chloroflexota bacterium]
MNRKTIVLLAIIFVQFTAMIACNAAARRSTPTASDEIIYEQISRETKIPVNAVKMLPETDAHPPILLSDEFENPIPLPGKVNTAGAEDSPFIMPDGNTLYFFFTPDVSIPAEKQLFDGVTGIYVSNRIEGEWANPARLWLQDSGKLALDGCEFVLGDSMWFCSSREGYTGINWFTAKYQEGTWKNWSKVDFTSDFKVGELHITSDGTELYFGSDRPGGQGKMDIWLSKKVNEEWQEPINVASVNTPDDEGWPAISFDGEELWFYRNYGIWRSKKQNGEWQEAEQIVSTLAGEPSLDKDGNLYFVHYYYVDDQMIEADIYVSYRK